MKDEENVEGAFERGIGPILGFGGAKEHVEKVARIAELIVGIDEWHAQGMAIRERRNRGDLSDETICLLLARLDAEDVLRVMIAGGKVGDRVDRHPDVMGVVR